MVVTSSESLRQLEARCHALTSARNGYDASNSERPFATSCVNWSKYTFDRSTGAGTVTETYVPSLPGRRTPLCHKTFCVAGSINCARYESSLLDPSPNDSTTSPVPVGMLTVGTALAPRVGEGRNIVTVATLSRPCAKVSVAPFFCALEFAAACSSFNFAVSSVVSFLV